MLELVLDVVNIFLCLKLTNPKFVLNNGLADTQVYVRCIISFG